MDIVKTRVIFRRWTRQSDGRGLIAWLLDMDTNPGMTMAYEHTGQHGEGDYHGCLKITRPVNYSDAADVVVLRRELESRGYDLKIVTRYSRKRNHAS